VAVRYRNAEARAEMELSDEWSVTPTRELTERLSQLFGYDGLRLVYASRMDA
jgi:DNA polymerase-3 subunit alpha